MNFFIRLAFVSVVAFSPTSYAENAPDKAETITTIEKSNNPEQAGTPAAIALAIENNQENTALPKTVAVATESEQLKELELYKELYNVSAKSNESMVAAVQWAVGILTTFTIALFSGQAFYSFRVSQKEFAKTHAQFDEKLTSELKKVDRELSTMKEVLTKRITDSVAELHRDMAQGIEEKVKTEVESLITSTDEKIDRLSGVAAANFKTIKYSISSLERYLWEVKDVKANTLRAYVEIYTYELGTPGSNSTTLRDISKLLDKMDKVDKSVKERLVALFESSKLDQELIVGITEKINKLPMYEFVDDSQGNLHAVDLK